MQPGSFLVTLGIMLVALWGAIVWNDRRPRTQNADVVPSPGATRNDEWVRNELATRIRQQLGDADAEDAKTGLVLAFIGAILVGGASLSSPNEAARDFQIATITLGVEALTFALLALYPRKYHDPPDPDSFSKDLLSGRFDEQWINEQLIRTQLAAIAHNDGILRMKLAFQAISGAFAVGATFVLLIRALAT